MNRIIWAFLLAAVSAFAGIASPVEAPVAASDVVPAVWRHHKITISYFGLTSLYACDALETHVRSILLHLGARQDAKVDANCPRGPEEPSHTAWISADFYTLSPADAASSSGIVNAYWAPREIMPHQPYFMGDGDCELIDQMRELISKSFSLRDFQYRTDCVPNEITVNGFSIEGQALIAVAQPAPQP